MHEPKGIGPYRSAGELPSAPRSPSSEPHTVELVRTPATFIGSVVALSIASAWACAVAFLVAIHWTLPPSDLAYNDPFWLALLDPFVLTIALPYSTLVGLVVAPIAVFALWHRDLLRAGLSVLGLTVLYILVLTPFNPLFAQFSSPVAAIACLLLCRSIDLPALRPHFRPWLAR